MAGLEPTFKNSQRPNYPLPAILKVEQSKEEQVEETNLRFLGLNLIFSFRMNEGEQLAEKNGAFYYIGPNTKTENLKNERDDKNTEQR